MTNLLKKGQFVWTDEASIAFEALKLAMTTAPVLQLPNFEKPFIVETDANCHGIGAVLMQGGHALAYLSKALGPKSVGLSIYEKEFLAILLAVQKWRSYFINGTFVIRTDQKSLKYLLEQKLSIPLQHKYLPKLMRFNYTIEYKKGLENKAADALSRKDEDGEIQHATVLQPAWVQEVMKSYDNDTEAKDIIAECTMSPFNVSYYSYTDGILKYKGKIYIGNNADFRAQVINYMHSSSIGGHSGIQGTYQKVQQVFLWPGLREQVKRFV